MGLVEGEDAEDQVMARFRKKPVEVEAVQWDGTLESTKEVAALLAMEDWAVSPPDGRPFWATLEGAVDGEATSWILSRGCWSIRHSDGNVGSLPHAHFEKSYEPIPEPGPVASDPFADVAERLIRTLRSNLQKNPRANQAAAKVARPDCPAVVDDEGAASSLGRLVAAGLGEGWRVLQSDAEGGVRTISFGLQAEPGPVTFGGDRPDECVPEEWAGLLDCSGPPGSGRTTKRLLVSILAAVQGKKVAYLVWGHQESRHLYTKTAAILDALSIPPDRMGTNGDTETITLAGGGSIRFYVMEDGDPCRTNGDRLEILDDNPGPVVSAFGDGCGKPGCCGGGDA